MKRSHRVYDAVKRVLDVVASRRAARRAQPGPRWSPRCSCASSSARPVLFRQQRPGRDGRIFTVYKFRTMRDAAPGSGAVDAVGTDAERLTRFGRILRSTSLDELPELVERASRRDEHRGPAPAARRVPAALQCRAGPPARGPPGNHRMGAGQRPQRRARGTSASRWTSGTWTTGRSLLDLRILVMTVDDGLSPRRRLGRRTRDDGTVRRHRAARERPGGLVRLLVVGAGGHAKVVVDAARAAGHESRGRRRRCRGDAPTCSASRSPTTRRGHRRRRASSSPSATTARAPSCFAEYRATGMHPAIVVHPSAVIADGVEIGAGTLRRRRRRRQRRRAHRRERDPQHRLHGRPRLRHRRPRARRPDVGPVRRRDDRRGRARRRRAARSSRRAPWASGASSARALLSSATCPHAHRMRRRSRPSDHARRRSERDLTARHRRRSRPSAPTPLPGWPAPGAEEIAAVTEVLRIRHAQLLDRRARAARFEARVRRARSAARTRSRSPTARSRSSSRCARSASAPATRSSSPRAPSSRPRARSSPSARRPSSPTSTATARNLTAETVAAVLTERTRAIIPVHLGGWPVDMDPLIALAAQHDLVVIEDCAQAHGGTYRGRPVGALGSHAAAFSFCQDKILPHRRRRHARPRRRRRLRARLGVQGPRQVAREGPRPRVHDRARPSFKWLVDSFGTNWRMDEMSAAVGRVGLAKLPAWHERAHAQRAAPRRRARRTSRRCASRCPPRTPSTPSTASTRYVDARRARARVGPRPHRSRPSAPRASPCQYGAAPRSTARQAFVVGGSRARRRGFPAPPRCTRPRSRSSCTPRSATPTSTTPSRPPARCWRWRADEPRRQRSRASAPRAASGTRVLVALDAAVIVVATVAAYYARFEGVVPARLRAVADAVHAFSRSSSTSRCSRCSASTGSCCATWASTRCSSSRARWRSAPASSCSSTCFVRVDGLYRPVPLGVLFIQALLVFLGASAARLAARVFIVRARVESRCRAAACSSSAPAAPARCCCARSRAAPTSGCSSSASSTTTGAAGPHHRRRPGARARRATSRRVVADRDVEEVLVAMPSRAARDRPAHPQRRRRRRRADPHHARARHREGLGQPARPAQRRRRGPSRPGAHAHRRRAGARDARRQGRRRHRRRRLDRLASCAARS